MRPRPRAMILSSAHSRGILAVVSREVAVSGPGRAVPALRGRAVSLALRREELGARRAPTSPASAREWNSSLDRTCAVLAEDGGADLHRPWQAFEPERAHRSVSARSAVIGASAELGSSFGNVAPSQGVRAMPGPRWPPSRRRRARRCAGGLWSPLPYSPSSRSASRQRCGPAALRYWGRGDPVRRAPGPQRAGMLREFTMPYANRLTPNHETRPDPWMIPIRPLSASARPIPTPMTMSSCSRRRETAR